NRRGGRPATWPSISSRVRGATPSSTTVSVMIRAVKLLIGVGTGPSLSILIHTQPVEVQRYGSARVTDGACPSGRFGVRFSSIFRVTWKRRRAGGLGRRFRFWGQ